MDNNLEKKITEKNISHFNALLRISLGLVGLAWSASHRRCRFPYFIAFLSAMKTAEGVLQFCPARSLIKRNKNTESGPVPIGQPSETDFPAEKKESPHRHSEPSEA